MSIPIIRIPLKDEAELTDKQAAQVILDEPWEAFTEVKAKILRVAKARATPVKLRSEEDKKETRHFHYRSEESSTYEEGRKLVEYAWKNNESRHQFGHQCGLRNDEIGIWKIGKYVYIVMKWPSPEPEDLPMEMTSIALRIGACPAEPTVPHLP